MNIVSRAPAVVIVPFVLGVVPILSASCASSAGRPGGTGPSIGIIDFRAQNAERLHDGIIRLAGDDSAGLAVREYLRIYEEELGKYLPAGSGTIAAARPNEPSTGVDPSWGGFPGDRPYPQNSQIVFSQLHASLLDARATPGMLRLIGYLDGRRLAAVAGLREHHAGFLTTGSLADAKLGLANAYVALTAMPPPNEVDLIAELVEPLLDALTTP